MNNDLEKIINSFCDAIAAKFNLSKEDVYSVWKESKKEVEDKKENKKEASKDDEITHDKILAANKDMLVGMCKKLSLKHSGKKKEELVAQLLQHISSSSTSSSSSSTASSSSSSSSSTSSSTKTKSKKEDKKEEPAVVKAVKERLANESERPLEIAIRKNQFGHYEHLQTGLVFNNEKMVYGRQGSDGKIIPLTSEDIELCKKYKFPCKKPENLNVSKSLDDVKIEDMEEEVLDEDDIDEIEEEEEIVEEDEI
jgi:hypothetical protein